ncbi:BgtA-20153 [Blumeria graminis f. sp. tritici]|uniref:BgtA-20153 n=2 Tax=Blumeria graminis f. sp. tritici TaxID=62690 RepID=A0A9X9QF96_BLUGR|nr:hypothetical protein BGT96224_A20153 [Blumeria graminis f. sp. tritici 96224]VDB92991.1 BgtA-20153 [Blumeria graminis f. sp. tritici]
MWSSKLFFLIGLGTMAYLLRKRLQKQPQSQRFPRHATIDYTKKPRGDSKVSSKKRLYPTLFDPDLKKRALVNQRLVRIFGLHNAFTTEDKEHYERQNFEESLARFFKAPNFNTFGYGDQNFASVEFIVNEALRLYPPTRRISRQTESGIVKVDIEGKHRDPEIWGADASCFRPNRWIEIQNEEKLAFIPFGAGKFECPAKRTVGPMMIGLLVASLTTVIGDGFTLCEELNDGPLPNEREALKDLKLLYH